MMPRVDPTGCLPLRWLARLTGVVRRLRGRPPTADRPPPAGPGHGGEVGDG
jgi:hypothetical protein